MRRRYLLAGSLGFALSMGLLLWFRNQPKEGDPAQNVQWLASGTPSKQVDKAYDSLIAAGSGAFPTLIAHLNDTTPADPRFERQVVVTAPDGSRHPHQPTVGDVCFDILQKQIEGVLPKGMAYYHVVNPEWLRVHHSMDLKALRGLAIREALLRAKAQKDLEAVRFLQNRLIDGTQKLP